MCPSGGGRRPVAGRPSPESAVTGRFQNLRDLPLVVETVDIVRRAVGDADLAGAYLHGSLALGNPRGTSDVDVLAIVRRPTSRDERRAIIDGLLEISGRRARRGPARPIELTVVQASELRPWRYPPTIELQYGEWLRDKLEAGRTPEPRPDPDLAVLVTAALDHAVVVWGPPAPELLDAVPRADVERSMLAGVPGLLADLESDTRNVVLTLARIWYTLETGDIRSKDEAARWATERLAREGPSLATAALDRARAMYLEGVDIDHWGPELPAARLAGEELVRRINGGR